jgi:hypothetical protein
MKRFFAVLLRVFLGIVAALALAVLALVVNWLVRREDPAAFLPADYVAYLQVPSLRAVYDRWLNLEAADIVLARPDLAAYRSAVADVRGLSLTSSRILRELLDVHADVMLLKGGKLVAVLDLGWRGILSPLARVVGPQLGVKGFSFLNDAGVPLYRYTTGATTIHAAIVNSVAVVSLDPEVVKASLELRRTDTGLAAKAGRDLLRRIRLRGGDRLRILADTRSLSVDLLSPLPVGARILDAVEISGQTMLDVGLSDQSLALDAGVPMTVSLADLAGALSGTPATVGVTRLVPSAATILSVVNVAPLGTLYRIAAAIQGKDVQDIYTKADAGAKSVIGMGIDDLLFSWAGAEAGMFMLPDSPEPVFFVRISDQRAWGKAMNALTTSVVAGKDSSLVLDGLRIDRLSLPWYVTLVLGTIGVDVPEPYYLERAGFFFLSLEPQNLAAMVKAADAGSGIAGNPAFAELTKGTPSNPSLMLWYDVTSAEPFFLHGAGLLADILRLYGRGVATVRLTPREAILSVAAARAAAQPARAVPGFPLAPEGGMGPELFAFRFAGASAPSLAWVRNRDTLVLADGQGRQSVEASLEPGVTLVPERDAAGDVDALWAASPGGTIWRFGPRLSVQAPFPVVTGISSPMPPAVVGARLLLFSKGDTTLAFISADGSRTLAPQRLESPLLQPPDEDDGRLVFYPKSFDAWVHLTDAQGTEAPGWPVAAAGISWSGPRFVRDGERTFVTFLTQAGSLHVWTLSGEPVPPFPIVLPGVFYDAPEPLTVEGKTALAVLSQAGELLLIGLDGTVLRRVVLPDVDGKSARLFAADVGAGQVLFVYGSGAFIAAVDVSLRTLPGFPVKGISKPQLVDLNRDGALDLVTAGLDGRIYAYTLGKAAR